MAERFCFSCRNTGYLVKRGPADSVDITSTRCPHGCPAAKRRLAPDGSLRDDVEVGVKAMTVVFAIFAFAASAAAVIYFWGAR